MALAAYRALLRATRVAFLGDARVLTAARAQIRSAFRANAALAPADPAVPPALAHAAAVAAFLRTNVVQGRRREGKDGSETYELRIHEYTHRGDNDSVKAAGEGVELLDGAKCS